MAVARGRFAGRTLYVAPGSKAEQQAAIWKDSRPADADYMRRLAAQPTTKWFGRYGGASNGGDWNDVDRYLDGAQAAGKLAALCLYWIKNRDNGSYSKGGAPTASEYRGWISTVADAIRGRECIVIGEADALAMLDRIPSAEQQERVDLLRYLNEKITAAGGRVYIDIGSSNWLPPTEAVRRLKLVGATGFSLNVSGTRYLADENAYGQRIRAAMGGDVRYVIDTSRNGRGSYTLQPGDPGNRHWLNAPGRGCGRRPSVNLSQTVSPGLDAVLYVKTVGSSDGADSFGHPAAGTFQPEEALGLVKRAVPPFARLV